MSRLVFNNNEISKQNSAIVLELPDRYKKFQQLDELAEFELDAEGNIVEQYTGPSIEEIEAELQQALERRKKE